MNVSEITGWPYSEAPQVVDGLGLSENTSIGDRAHYIESSIQTTMPYFLPMTVQFEHIPWTRRIFCDSLATRPYL